MPTLTFRARSPAPTSIASDIPKIEPPGPPDRGATPAPRIPPPFYPGSPEAPSPPSEAVAIDEERYLLHSVQWRVQGLSVAYLPWILGMGSALFPLITEVDSRSLLPWVLCLLGVVAARILHLRQVRRDLDQARGPALLRIHRFVSAGFVLQAAITGALVWVVGPQTQPALQVFATLLIALSVVGAFVAMTADPRMYAAGLVAALGQPILYWLWNSRTPGEEGIALAVVLACALGLTIKAARRNGELHRQTFLAQFRNADLLARLQREKDAALEARAQAEEATRAAEQADRAKSRFLAAASHDLRQPIYALVLFADSLCRQLPDGQALTTAGHIRTSVDALDRLLKGLLELSTFDAQGVVPHPETFELRTLADQLETEYRIQTEARGLHLSVASARLSVCTDRVLIERVLRNLLTNAVAHTSKGGISLLARRVGDRAEIEVSDTGSGIPLEEQRRVFEDLVQLRNPARQRHRGTGLGLAVVNRINRLLDLRLELDSHPGEGTRFRLSIPLGQPNIAPADCVATPERSEPLAPTHQEESADAEDQRPRKCLGVIEDDPLVADALVAQLESWGYEPLHFPSADALEEALAVGPIPVSLYLVDDMLGDGPTGFEVAQRLCHLIPQRRIVMMTGGGEPDRHDEIRQAGFTLLIKPVALAHLRELLARRTTENP